MNIFFFYTKLDDGDTLEKWKKINEIINLKNQDEKDQILLILEKSAKSVSIFNKKKYIYIKLEANHKPIHTKTTRISQNKLKNKYFENIIGDFNEIEGDNLFIKGNKNIVTGKNNFVAGNFNVVDGKNNKCDGYYNTVNGVVYNILQPPEDKVQNK